MVARELIDAKPDFVAETITDLVTWVQSRAFVA